MGHGEGQHSRVQNRQPTAPSLARTCALRASTAAPYASAIATALDLPFCFLLGFRGSPGVQDDVAHLMRWAWHSWQYGAPSNRALDALARKVVRDARRARRVSAVRRSLEAAKALMHIRYGARPCGPAECSANMAPGLSALAPQPSLSTACSSYLGTLLGCAGPAPEPAASHQSSAAPRCGPGARAHSLRATQQKALQERARQEAARGRSLRLPRATGGVLCALAARKSMVARR